MRVDIIKKKKEPAAYVNAYSNGTYLQGAKGEAYYLNEEGVLIVSIYSWEKVKDLLERDVIPLHQGDAITLTF
jgi:hypothetical protein